MYCSGELVDRRAVIWESRSERIHHSSIRWEIYKAYPWLGPARVPTETDEFVATAGVAQMDGSHWMPGRLLARLRLCNIDKDSIMSSKSAYRKAGTFARPRHLTLLLSFQPRCSLSSCWIAVISRRRVVNVFVTPGGERELQLQKISPLHLHRNTLTGFQSHCQSLNLCLSVAECLSECEWTCVECVYAYLALQWINMLTWPPIIGGSVPWWQMGHQWGHFN